MEVSGEPLHRGPPDKDGLRNQPSCRRVDFLSMHTLPNCQTQRKTEVEHGLLEDDSSFLYKQGGSHLQCILYRITSSQTF